MGLVCLLLGTSQAAHMEGLVFLNWREKLPGKGIPEGGSCLWSTVTMGCGSVQPSLSSQIVFLRGIRVLPCSHPQ